ncbi:unnamed protein product, partial [Didymodactylos carnosus]
TDGESSDLNMNDLRSRLNQRRELFVFRPYHH